MIQQRSFALLASILLSLVETSAWAQTRTNIGDLQRSNGLTIAGRVVSVVGNSFTLEDGSGQIIVDAGPRWWQPVTLAPGERVTVVGELGRSGEFDAFSITRANGSIVKIRSPQGPPPWAGSANRGRRNQ
jgi:hypothetical protein